MFLFFFSFIGYKKSRSSLIQNDISLENFLSYNEPVDKTKSILNSEEIIIPTTEIQAKSHTGTEEIVIPTTETQTKSHPDSEEIVVPTTEVQAESQPDSEEIVIPTTEVQAESRPDSEEIVMPTTEIQAKSHTGTEEIVVPTTEVQAEFQPDLEEIFVPTTEVQAEFHPDSEKNMLPTTKIQAKSHTETKEIVVPTAEVQAEFHPNTEEIVVPTTEIQTEYHAADSSKSDESLEGVSELSTDSGISKDLEKSILAQQNTKEEIKHATIKSQLSLDDSFIDIDVKTVNGTISAVVKEHIPTTSHTHENDSEQIITPMNETSTPRFEEEEEEEQVEDDLDATPVLDAEQQCFDNEDGDDEESELLRSLDKTSKKNVFTNSSMEMARENLILINPEEDRTDSSIDNESFYSVRSDNTITDTDNTSFVTATDRLTPTQDLSFSVPDLTVISHGASKNNISKSTSSLKNRRSLGGSKFEIQFIDEKTNRVMSRESLTASFDASAATSTNQLTKQQKRLSGPPKSPGKETSV